MTTDNHNRVTLAQLRQSAGLSQSAVADRMGVNQSRVSQIEKDFPNLHYTVVANYFRAIDVHPRLSAGDQHFVLDDIEPDPRSAGAQTRRSHRSPEGIQRLRSASEELPLEQRESDTGGDDTGREVDQPDTEGDQANGEDGKDT